MYWGHADYSSFYSHHIHFYSSSFSRTKFIIHPISQLNLFYLVVFFCLSICIVFFSCRLCFWCFIIWSILNLWFNDNNKNRNTVWWLEIEHSQFMWFIRSDFDWNDFFAMNYLNILFKWLFTVLLFNRWNCWFHWFQYVQITIRNVGTETVWKMSLLYLRESESVVREFSNGWNDDLKTFFSADFKI